MQLEPLISDYLEYLKYEQQGSSATCCLRYYELHQFRRYLAETHDLHELPQLGINHLRGFIAQLHANGSQPVSLGNMISTLRALYSYAVHKGLVPVNLARRLKKPHLEKKEVEHFTWEEVEAIFLAVPRDDYYLRNLCMLLLFYYCGLRLEELRNVKITDFSADLSELYVEKGKGDKSRLLPVHPFLQRVLQLYLGSRAGSGQTVTAAASPYLFTGRGDKPLNKRRIYGIVKECGRLAGLQKRVSPHVFRHSFATHLHRQKVDINCLAQLLGHSNIEKTTIYTHTEDSELTEAVLKLKEKRAAYGRGRLPRPKRRQRTKSQAE